MAERLADVTTQIESVRQLKAIVVAMRAIAALRAQQGRALLAGVASYSDVISGAIGQALALLPEAKPAPLRSRRNRRALIVFCAEQGFAGAFNERIFAVARAELASATIFLIGTRGIMLANERAINVFWSAAMATQVGGIPGLANRVAEALYERIAVEPLSEVEIIYPRTGSGSSIQVDRQSLFPIDLSRFERLVSREPPLVQLRPAFLVERLAAEYVYAELCAAATYAFAAENEARMMVMAAAKTNIEAKLDALAERERQLRQQEITAEVVELAAGAEALEAVRGL